MNSQYGGQSDRGQLGQVQRPGLGRSTSPLQSEKDYRYRLWAWCIHEWEKGPAGVCAKCGDNPVDHLKRNERNLEAFYPKGTYARAVWDLRQSWGALVKAMKEALGL
jgi:hypothetical protein